MEIDFLGINSEISEFVEQKNMEAVRDFADSESGEDDISLSLCTSSQLDRSGTEFSDFRKKRTWKFHLEKMASVSSSLCSTNNSNNREKEQSCLSLVGRPILHPSGFLNSPTHNLAISRNTFDLPTQPASAAIFCQADHKMYVARNTSSEDTQNSARGYVPTIAMARSATLARFLEKRSHRLTQPRKSHLLGKKIRESEVGHMNATKCHKKNYNSIRS